MSTLSNRFVLGFGLALLLIEFAFPHLSRDARNVLASVMTGPKHQIAAEQRDEATDGDRTGSIARSGAARASANAVTVWQYTVRPPVSAALMQCRLQQIDPVAHILRLKPEVSPPRTAPTGHHAAQL